MKTDEVLTGDYACVLVSMMLEGNKAHELQSTTGDNQAIVKLLRWALTAALVSPLMAESAAELGRKVLSAGLDASECYRVRDLSITEADARFSFTDGYLMFGKAVAGAPITAVFSGDEGGDGEVLMMPTDRAERKSLAGYTGAPNLNEHFTQAAFLFTDATVQALREQLRETNAARAPDMAVLMLERWNPVITNLMVSFESRIVLDLLTPDAKQRGFFGAVIQGKKLGNFDIIYDARGYEQLIAGALNYRNGGVVWDTWASFPVRSRRGLPPPQAEEQILSYQIDVTLDTALIMRCVTRMKVRTTEESRKVLAFDLSGEMHATAVKVDGRPAEVYERDSVRAGLVQNSGNELLMVLPATPLEPGTVHEIEIAHEGKVIREAGHQVYYVNARGTWYPARDMQFATYDVTYRYPKTLDLVAAGRVMEDRVEGDDRITRRIPDGRVRQLGFNLGSYQRVKVERAGITVEVCANNELEDALRPRPATVPQEIPEILRSRVRGPDTPLRGTDLPAARAMPVPAEQNAGIAEQVASAAAFYRAKFGDPPLKHIEVTPIPVRFGQGFAGMIYLPTLNYLTPGGDSPTEQKFFRDLLVAHEVAHQWWGNIVTSASYHHEWLMESLASYSAILYLEARSGPKATEMALESYRRALLTKNADGIAPEAEGPVVQGRRLPNAVIYGKGTWILHMLRRKMGDERFLKMLAELRRRYEWKTLDTESFRLLCAEFLPAGTGDAKLEGFFDQWVYGTGVPTLKMTYAVKGKPGAYKLSGTVTQADAPDDFSVAVPIEIQSGRGKPMVVQARTGDGAAAFQANVASAAAKAVLDPGWSVLRR